MTCEWMGFCRPVFRKLQFAFIHSFMTNFGGKQPIVNHFLRIFAEATHVEAKSAE